MKESKGNLDKIKTLEDMCAALMQPDDKVTKLETDIAFLREKLKVFEEKLKHERDANINLYSTVRLNKKASQEATLGSTDEETKRFLSGANCTQLLKPENPYGFSAYCMDALPEEFPLYGTEGVLFMKMSDALLMVMMMGMYADTWENLDIDKLKAKQERKRTMSGGSSHY